MSGRAFKEIDTIRYNSYALGINVVEDAVSLQDGELQEAKDVILSDVNFSRRPGMDGIVEGAIHHRLQIQFSISVQGPQEPFRGPSDQWRGRCIHFGGVY